MVVRLYTIEVYDSSIHVAPSMGPRHCLSHESTVSAKLALEKQTSQPSLIMVLLRSDRPAPEETLGAPFAFIDSMIH